MIKGLILRLRSLLTTKRGSTEKENEKTYLGRVTILQANNLRNGQRVLTVRGIGTIMRRDGEEIVTSLRGNYIRRRDKKENILQYFVYNEKLVKILNISFCDYNYLLEEGQPIVYRITNRGFAKLAPESKNYYEMNKTIHRTKGGLKMYAELKKKGYELKKRNINQ